MVVPLGPGKFYGSSLPRPRIYTDVKLNSDRVDPPVPVMDPLVSWAQEAHWSMGGLSFQRLRLQGRIEGNVNRLRKQREKQGKLQASYSPRKPIDEANSKGGNNRKRVRSVSPPPAPKVLKRRKYMDLFEEDGEGEEQEAVEKVIQGSKKRPARKLVGEFDKVAKEIEVNDSVKVCNAVGLRTRRGFEEGTGIIDSVMKEVEGVNGEYSEGNKFGKKAKSKVEIGSDAVSEKTRTSPRLAKQRSR